VVDENGEMLGVMSPHAALRLAMERGLDLVEISPNTIAEGDYQVKLRNAIKFLSEGDKVRVSLQFKGREITHDEVGFAVINKFKAALLENAKVEVEPKMEGRQIFMILSPK